MDERMTVIASRMFGQDDGTPGLPILDPSPWMVGGADPVARVTAAFLVAVAGAQRNAELQRRHPCQRRNVAGHRAAGAQ